MQNVTKTGMITAQKPTTNQCNTFFGTFNESELAYIVDNSSQSAIKANFAINYLTQAEKMLDRARMNEKDKNFIKGAFQLLVGFGKYKEREHMNLTYENHDIDDIVAMVEDGEDMETIEDALEYELGNIVLEMEKMLKYNKDGFYDDDLAEYADAVNEFLSIIPEYNIPCDTWLLDEAYDVWTRARE